MHTTTGSSLGTFMSHFGRDEMSKTLRFQHLVFKQLRFIFLLNLAAVFEVFLFVAYFGVTVVNG